MNYVHLTNDRLLGSYEWEGKIDLLGIVLIGLSKELPEYDEKYELHRLLGALLSRSLSSEEKLRVQIYYLRKESPYWYNHSNFITQAVEQ